MMNSYIMARLLSLVSIIVIGLFIFGNTAQSAQLSDSGSGVQMTGDVGSGNVATPASQEQGQVSDQAQQPPQQAADLREDEMTYFDPSTIPDSPPITDADWVFEVPIDVSNLPPEVTQLGIVCKVFRLGTYQHPDQMVIYGKGYKMLDLDGGSYSGSVLIGASDNFTIFSGEIRGWYKEKYKADKCQCSMYLIDSNNYWAIPKNTPVSPLWRRADPDRPFRWITGNLDIPEEAQVGRAN